MEGAVRPSYALPQPAPRPSLPHVHARTRVMGPALLSRSAEAIGVAGAVHLCANGPRPAVCEVYSRARAVGPVGWSAIESISRRSGCRTLLRCPALRGQLLLQSYSSLLELLVRLCHSCQLPQRGSELWLAPLASIGSWCMVHGAWFMVHGSWFMVHGSWFMVHGSWLPPFAVSYHNSSHYSNC